MVPLKTDYTSIYILITLIFGVFAYYTFKKSLPYLKTHFYLKKHGDEVYGLVTGFELNKFSRGVVPVVEYEVEGRNYTNVLFHDEFAPNYTLKLNKKIKILVDKNDPNKIVDGTPLSIMASFLVLLIIIGLFLTLFIFSVSQSTN